MKIEKDDALYKEIANFSVKRIRKVTNRKGWETRILIDKITDLSWRELQLLMSDGEDRFTKQVLLYRKFINDDESGQHPTQEQQLTPAEEADVTKYIEMYRDNSFDELSQLNQHISDNNLWGEYRTIRSLNDHGINREIPGIQPKYYGIVCGILRVSGEGGRPLDAYKKY